MKIFGQVLDTDNQPMSLANIVIITGEKANKIGEQADLDGNFALENELINPDSEFKISYVGYVPQFLKASELQGKKIKMLEDIQILDEVVIMGDRKGKPNDNNIKKTNSLKSSFVHHLQKHKFIYGGIGALAGVLLIVKALKK